MRGKRGNSGLAGHKRKAQSGVEYIVLVAFLLIVITPIFLYAMDISTISVRTSRAREVVESLAIAADNICGMGGGKTTAKIYMPYGVQFYVIGNRTVKIRITINEGTGDVFATTKCNVTGNLSSEEGYNMVPVSMLPNGTVLIGGI